MVHLTYKGCCEHKKQQMAAKKYHQNAVLLALTTPLSDLNWTGGGGLSCRAMPGSHVRPIRTWFPWRSRPALWVLYGTAPLGALLYKVAGSLLLATYTANSSRLEIVWVYLMIFICPLIAPKAAPVWAFFPRHDMIYLYRKYQIIIEVLIISV